MKQKNVVNISKMFAFTALLGAVSGIVIWGFIKIVSFLSGLIWEKIPETCGTPFIMIFVCAAGGLAAGILHKKFGNYPEPLHTVLAKVKKKKHYDYHPMFVMIICAVIPLAFGASVGPEAGLAGIIAALCYWVGDNVAYAKKHTALYSQIGEAVSLGQLFHSPLFGIFAVEEDPDFKYDKNTLPRVQKLLLYGISTVAAFFTIEIFNELFGKGIIGYTSFPDMVPGIQDYLMILIYVPIGLFLYMIFEFCESAAKSAAGRFPVVLREMFCGAVIGVMGLLIPLAIFSGEENMAGLVNDFGVYAPWFLIGLCFLKIFLTAFCIKFGMKGGHFFPLIYACSCMGFGVSMLVFPESTGHAIFAAGIITAVTLGAQLRKPFAVALLMLLCFPVRFLFWGFLTAVIGTFFAGKIRKSHADFT